MRKTKKLLLVALALVIVALAALAACEPKPETFSLTFDFGYDNLKEVVEIKEGEKAGWGVLTLEIYDNEGNRYEDL